MNDGLMVDRRWVRDGDDDDGCDGIGWMMPGPRQQEGTLGADDRRAGQEPPLEPRRSLE